MKKLCRLLCLILIVCLSIGMLAACGGDDDDDGGSKKKKSDKDSSSESSKDKDKDKDKDTGKDKDKDKDKPSKVNYTLADQVIYENDEFAFTVVKADEDDFWGFELKLLCENKTSDKKLSFSMDDVSVNGYRLDPYWSTEVAAGKKENSNAYFNTDRFKDIGITSADAIQFTLRVYDSDNWWDEGDKLKETFTIYPTGLSAGEVKIPERRKTSTEQVVVNDDQFTAIILDNVYDEVWGYTVNFYFENNSDKKVSFNFDDVSVNGYMLDPYFTVTLAPGMKAYDSMSFSDTRLKDSNITKVEEIEYKIRIYDPNDWMSDNLYEATQTYKPAD
ncbi:MAG: hypothetical protein J5872_02420 [Lachnospiraceae bacterium]|nr:hypothetical protein [Lachnospiraceae bacterium]